jgi:hypothetical protein
MCSRFLIEGQRLNHFHHSFFARFGLTTLTKLTKLGAFTKNQFLALVVVPFLVINLRLDSEDGEKHQSSHSRTSFL